MKQKREKRKEARAGHNEEDFDSSKYYRKCNVDFIASKSTF